MLKKRATSGASSTPIPVNTTTSAMLSVNAVWMRSVKPCSCSYWTVAFIPRSLPSSTNARKTVTAATAPNSDGTSRRASTSMETNVTALAITNVIVVHATPRRNERPQSSELTCAPRGRDGARRRAEHLVVEGPKPLRPARGGEVVLVAPPAALAEPVAKRVVREQPVELGGERAGPRWRVEQHASLAVEDDLRDSAHLGREHGHARGTGLDERGGERVDARGVKQDVGGVEQLHDVLSVPRHDCSRAEGPQQLGDVPWEGPPPTTSRRRPEWRSRAARTACAATSWPLPGRSTVTIAATCSCGSMPSSRRTAAPAPGRASAAMPLWIVTMRSGRSQPSSASQRCAASDTVITRAAVRLRTKPITRARALPRRVRSQSITWIVA